MSRRDIPAKRPGTTVVVGWGNPMQTFFTQVEDENAGDDADLLWLGGRHGEMRRPEDLVRPLAPFAELTGPHLDQLRADRAACLDRGPTPLQRLGTRSGWGQR